MPGCSWSGRALAVRPNSQPCPTTERASQCHVFKPAGQPVVVGLAPEHARPGVNDNAIDGVLPSIGLCPQFLQHACGRDQSFAQPVGHSPCGLACRRRILALAVGGACTTKKIEAWVLEQAGVKFDSKAEPGKLTLAA